MSDKESKIKSLIQDYLLDEGLLRKKIPDPKLEFGFQFTFPPGKDPTGRPIGKTMLVYKPKEKHLIVISIGTQISQPHINALNSLEESKRLNFFMDLRKHFLMKDVLYRIDIQNYRYEIIDQFFLSKSENISKDTFFKSVRKVFNSMAFSNIILGEYCAGKIKPEDISKSKEFSTGSDFTLYS